MYSSVCTYVRMYSSVCTYVCILVYVRMYVFQCMMRILCLRLRTHNCLSICHVLESRHVFMMYEVCLLSLPLSPFLSPFLPLSLPPSILARFNHTVTKALSSWAGIMDVHSLRNIPAPQFLSGTVELPPKSIFLATYNNQKMPQTPKKKKEYLTIYPQDSSTIMVPIRSTTFEISVDFVIPSSILEQLYVVTLQFGSLGPPSYAVWTGVVDCYKNGTKFVSFI